MEVSIVVAAHNSERTIGKCIEALLKQSYENYEIIIVDDGSTDKTYEIAKQYPVKLIKIQHSGIGKAQNIGIKKAKGEIIFLTNSDCYVPRDWISRLIEWFKKDDKIMAVGGGRIEVGDKYSEINNEFDDEVHITNTLGAYNCAFRRQVIEEIGLFDEKISSKKASCEDTLFFAKISLRGYKLVRDNRVKVLHDHPLHSYANGLRKAFNYGYRLKEIFRREVRKVFSKRFIFFPLWFLIPFIEFKRLYKFRQQIKNFYVYCFFRSLYRLAHTFGKFVGYITSSMNFRK